MTFGTSSDRSSEGSLSTNLSRLDHLTHFVQVDGVWFSTASRWQS